MRAGYFSAIVRAPITGIVLISEMTGSFSHLLTLAIVSLFAYLIPYLGKSATYLRSASPQDAAEWKAEKEYSGEKVLLDSVVSYGSAAQNKRVADRIVLLCDEEAAPAAH